MAEEITHIQVTLDQQQIQTLKAGLVAIQISAAQVDAHLNDAVRSAVESAQEPAPLPASNGHAKLEKGSKVQPSTA